MWKEVTGKVLEQRQKHAAYMRKWVAAHPDYRESRKEYLREYNRNRALTPEMRERKKMLNRESDKKRSRTAEYRAKKSWWDRAYRDRVLTDEQKRGRERRNLLKSGLRFCVACGKVKPATDEFFYRERRTKTGWQSRCKLCITRRVETVCSVCGKKKMRVKASLKRWNGMCHYCSVSGPKNVNWKGGVMKFRPNERSDPGLTVFRRAVLKRDGYRCRICGAGGELHAHHIVPFSKSVELRTDPNNGITVCPVCHKNVLHRGKWQNEPIAFPISQVA